MLSRNEKGKLCLKSLDLEIFMGEMFQECKNDSEVEWLQEQLQSCAEILAGERLDEI